jgi:hypothetical protein
LLIVLALVRRESVACRELLNLRGLMPKPYCGIAAICPVLEKATSLHSELANLGIHLTSMSLEPPYLVALPNVEQPPQAQTTQICLDEQDEAEFVDYAFRSRLPISLPGTRHPSKGNVVLVNGDAA